jgi:hypothetical protein
MITNEIRFGGTLHIGDFIMVGSDYGFTYGWYSGNGKAGNIQFISPSMVYFANDGNQPFTFNNIKKSFVRDSRKDNVVKITNPERVFTNEYLRHYIEAKELLTKINFLKP